MRRERGRSEVFRLIRSRRSLLLSLALHAALLALALWHRAPPPKPRPTYMEVVVDAGSQGAGGGTKQDTGRGKSHGKPGVNLRDFGLGFGPGKPRGDGAPEGGGDAYATAEGMGVVREGKLYPYFHQIWRRIDAATGYPEDFVQSRISGKVTVQFEVDRRGVFTGWFVSADGDDDRLKAYVMAIIAHALREPLSENALGDREQMVLAAEFSFKVYTRGGGVGGRVLEPGEQHFKNQLRFERVSYADPWLNEKVNKLLTRYMPPIIPVPGGFIIDFVRAYQFVQNIGKPDPDRLRDDRLKMRKEEWDRIVRPAIDQRAVPALGP